KIAGSRRRVMLKPVQGVIDPWRRERSQGFGLTAPAPPCAIHDSVVSQSQIGHIKMIAQYIAQIGGVVSRYVLAFLKGKVQRNGRVGLAYFHRHPMILQQQAYLFPQIAAIRSEERRVGKEDRS